MRPEIAKLLLDMKRAADRIARFVAGKTYEDYLSDELLRSPSSVSLRSSEKP